MGDTSISKGNGTAVGLELKRVAEIDGMKECRSTAEMHLNPTASGDLLTNT